MINTLLLLIIYCFEFKTIAKHLYEQLGVEPRELFSVESYETIDADGMPQKGYLYNYNRENGPIRSHIQARLNQKGHLLDAIQTK